LLRRGFARHSQSGRSVKRGLCCLIWHNTDLNLGVLIPPLEVHSIPFGDRTSVSAEALTLVETHLL